MLRIILCISVVFSLIAGCTKNKNEFVAIELDFDMGEYADYGKWLLHYERVEDGDYLKDEVELKINEHGKMVAKVKANTFGFVVVWFVYRNKSLSWNHNLPLFINGKNNIKAKVIAKDNKIQLDKKSVDNINILAYTDFHTKMSYQWKNLWRKQPTPDNLIETAKEFNEIWENLIAENPGIDDSLNAFIKSEANAACLKLQLDYSYFGSVNSECTKLINNPTNIFDNDYLPFINGGVNLAARALDFNNQYGRQNNFETLTNKIETISEDYTNRKASDKIIFYLLDRFISKYQVEESFSKEELKFNLLCDLIENEEERFDLKSRFKLIRHTLPNAEVPDVVLTDEEGKEVKLKSLFKANYIFIDLWASWCKPCREQIPALLKLEKEYAEKKITFVGISSDKKDSAWKKALKQENLHGVQLRDSDAKLLECLRVSSVPRFVLYSPEGKLINPNTPRPSSPKLKELLNTYLNQ
jgi:thiol-disulfide isomerase/thioredoxin